MALMPESVEAYRLCQCLIAAILMILKFVLPGSGWALLMGRRLPPHVESPVSHTLVCLALSALLSTIFALFAATALGFLGLFTTAADWTLTALFAFSGAMLAVRSRSSGPGISATAWAVSLLAICAAFLTAMLLPSRGEWIAGGLDPGVYVNHGVCLARNGSNIPDAPTFLRGLTEDERDLFVLKRDNRRQHLPGVILADGDRELRFQFFPLTPSFAANLYHCGGIRAAVRMNHFAAILSILQLASFLLIVSRPGHAIAAVVILCLQPIQVWHLQIPVSEMLEQFLELGLLAVLAMRRAGKSFPAVAGLILIACMLNRFSFLPFGFMLLTCGAFMDRMEGMDRRRLLGLYAALAAFLCAGGVLSYASAPAAVQGWNEIILGLLGIPLAATVAIALIALFPARAFVDRIKLVPSGLWSALWLLWVPVLVFAPPILYRLFETVYRRNLLEVLPYLGLPCALLAWTGAVLVWLDPRASRSFRLYVVFATGAVSILMLRKFIDPLYPWATRRYLHTLVPAVAILAGYIAWRAWSILREHRPRLLPALGIVLVLVAAERAHLVRLAWRATEYDGFTSALSQVAACAPNNALVLADHHLCATPLAMIHGKDVLVPAGLDPRKPSRSKEYFEKVLAVLRLINAEKPVYVFTSTAGGLDIFPAPLPVGEALAEAELDTQKVLMRKRWNPFRTAEVHRVLRLYRIEPGAL